MGAFVSEEQKMKIVILGGTAEAYLAACAIGHQYRHDRLALTVVDSGGEVAESAVSLQQESLPFVARFGLNEKLLAQNVESSYRLGTRFENWTGDGSAVVQPLGTHGGPMDLVAFESYATKKRRVDPSLDYNDYSLGAAAALSGKFLHPQIRPDSILATLGYAQHLDSSELRAWLKRLSFEQGVAVESGAVERIESNDNRGIVEKLHLDNGQVLSADLIIDCSNQADGKIGQALGIGFESWRQYFPNDRRIAFRQAVAANWKPLTEVAAHPDGIVRKAPFESGVLGEFYYSSSRFDEDAATERLKRIEPELTAISSAAACESGIRQSAWCGNYVALGKAYGRYEPLDVSNFQGFLVGLDRLLALFPRTSDFGLEAREFNRKTRLWYENMRDFNLMRHAALATSDQVKPGSDDLPETFRHKLKLFTRTAKMPYVEEEPFAEPYRVSAYINMGFWPETHDVMIERFEFEKLDERFDEMKRLIAETVAGMPNHVDYVKRLLASQ